MIRQSAHPAMPTLEVEYAELWHRRQASQAEARRLGGEVNAAHDRWRQRSRALFKLAPEGFQPNGDPLPQRLEWEAGYRAEEEKAREEMSRLQVAASQASTLARELSRQINELWPRVQTARRLAADLAHAGDGSVVGDHLRDAVNAEAAAQEAFEAADAALVAAQRVRDERWHAVRAARATTADVRQRLERLKSESSTVAPADRSALPPAVATLLGVA